MRLGIQHSQLQEMSSASKFFANDTLKFGLFLNHNLKKQNKKTRVLEISHSNDLL